MMIIYHEIIQSVIQYGITAWFGNLTVKNKLDNMHKIAIIIIGRREYEPIQSLYDSGSYKTGYEK